LVSLWGFSDLGGFPRSFLTHTFALVEGELILIWDALGGIGGI